MKDQQPLVSIAIILFLSFILFVLYVNQFEWTFDVIVTTTTLCLCNMLFIGITHFNLSGKRLDPHQANSDRTKQISFSIKSMVFISIFASLFLIATVAMETYDWERLEILINSLYFQGIAFLGIGSMLRTIQIKDIDFTVYKKDNATV